MYYRRAQIERGRRVINIGVILLNILVLLNFPYDIYFEKAISITALRRSIFIEIIVVIVTLFYYKGNRLASWFMAFFLQAMVTGFIILPIMLISGLLSRFGLLDFGGGILYIIVPVILVIVFFLLISRTKVYNDCIEFWVYQKENRRK